MNILERLDRQPSKYHLTGSILFTLVIGFLDYWMGFEYRMKIFYLMPISYATWFIGKTGIVFLNRPVMTMLYSGVVSEKQ
jgi:hypothetical protein